MASHKLLKGEVLEPANTDQLQRYCFRNMFIRGDDVGIGRIVQNYFTAVSQRWDGAWNNFSQGAVLNKTNGFRAFASVMGKIYVEIATPGDVPDTSRFLKVFEKIQLSDDDFTTENFRPGTSGEARLRNKIIADVFDL